MVSRVYIKFQVCNNPYETLCIVRDGYYTQYFSILDNEDETGLLKGCLEVGKLQ